MRYLLTHHVGLVFAVLLLIVMLVFGHVVAPYIVHQYGLVGTVIGLGAIFAIGYWLDR